MRSPPVSAAETPEAVVRLLKSYDPAELLWAEPDHRHVIVVAILTRGTQEAKEWLWSVLSREDARELVREYRGACCAEPERAQLRKELALTTSDIPWRPFIGFNERWDAYAEVVAVDQPTPSEQRALYEIESAREKGELDGGMTVEQYRRRLSGSGG